MPNLPGRYRFVGNDNHHALIRGAFLKPGAHVDLVGGFTPLCAKATTMRSRDPAFVDTRAGATKEAGDIAQPLARRAEAGGTSTASWRAAKTGPAERWR
jgi:ornithine cyclodeaminase/alanine dehydrogenase-like protein (mu-crystallin family)